MVGTGTRGVANGVSEISGNPNLKATVAPFSVFSPMLPILDTFILSWKPREIAKYDGAWNEILIATFPLLCCQREKEREEVLTPPLRAKEILLELLK